MRIEGQGKITEWNDEKGYGFITPARGYDRIFVHIKSFKNRKVRPQINRHVAFVCSKDKQGRPCALEVSYIGREPKTQQNRKAQKGACILVSLFFVALGVLTIIIKAIPPFIIAAYGIASAITFITYAIDKAAAEKGDWRVAEATLHAMALFGGWPGALLAQQTLRHKSSKHSFQAEYWGTVIVNLAVTSWLLTPHGPEMTLAFLEKVFK